MKKQLFALALTTLLVGCVRNVHQQEVSYAEFKYHTNGKDTLAAPKTSKVNQVIKVKTTNFEKIGKDPENYTIKSAYSLTFNPDGTFISVPEYHVLYEPCAISSELADTYNGNDYTWTYYIDPLRVVFQKTIYSPGVTPRQMRTFIYDFTFGKEYWVSKVVATAKLKYSDPETKVVAERVEVETVTYSYTF